MDDYFKSGLSSQFLAIMISLPLFYTRGNIAVDTHAVPQFIQVPQFIPHGAIREGSKVTGLCMGQFVAAVWNDLLMDGHTGAIIADVL